MTEKRFINDVDNGKLYDTKGEMYTIHYDDRVDFYTLWEFLNKLNDENEYLKKKILEEIDLEVAYVNETYSDGRMSKEQYNGAIISLRQLREKFE